MAQPDFETLSNSLIATGQQVALLPNVPTVNENQAILASLERIQDAMRGLRTDVRQVREEVRGIQTRLNASETNAVSRLFNSTINNPQTHFQPLQSRQNIAPRNFPLNGEALASLNRPELADLLQAYDLPADGNMVEKKRRLAQFIGVVAHVV